VNALNFDPRAIVAWACALAITSAGVIVSADPRALAQSLMLMPFVLGAAPYLLLIGMVAIGTRRIAAGFALVYCGGLAALAVLALAVAGNDAAGFMVLLAEAAGVAVVTFMFAHIGLVIGAVALMRGREPGYGWLGQALIVAVLATSTLVAVHVWRYVESPARHTEQRLTRALDARVAVLRLNRCLAEHHATHGEYPRALGAIGPAGSRCAERALIEDGIDGYQVTYRATGGGYELHLRARAANGLPQDSRRSDETGAVYHSLNADGGGGSAGVDPLPVLAQISRCVQDYRRLDPAGGYPRDLATAQSERACFSRYGVDDEQGRAVVEVGRLDGFQYVYTARSAGPVADGFTLELRPVRYGRPHTRSYTCTASGVLYWTDEDRPAAAGDPDYQQDPVTLEIRRDYCIAP